MSEPESKGGSEPRRRELLPTASLCAVSPSPESTGIATAMPPAETWHLHRPGMLGQQRESAQTQSVSAPVKIKVSVTRDTGG